MSNYISHIKILSQDLISKIAAGEVVERPASVIKELVENALDAKASYIQITLIQGGTKKITVKDDGIGMERDDVVISFLPHSTSKISSLEDLFSITTFGFRGEALASIAAVSLLTIKSRPQHQEYGNQIELHEGIIQEETRIGMPCGTEITVESLFHSTPARKKFLKDTSTELRLIMDTITRFTLAYPAVSFKVVHENTVLLNVSHGQDLKDRIKSMLGEYIAKEIIPVEYENRYGKIEGFISRPQIANRNRQHQYLFVNGRTIIDNNLSGIIKERYGSLLEPRAHPPFVLFFTLPFESVDVNIHPKKLEVGFIYEQEIKKLVSDAVQDTLHKHDLTYREQSPVYDYNMDRNTASILRELVTPWNLKSEGATAILQIKNLYLVTMTDNGLLIVDQHAAHERILYEQFKDAFMSSQENPSLYSLPQPLVFDLSISESLALQEKKEVFQKLGFDIEYFGERTFKLTSVPHLFKNRDYILLITEVLHDVISSTFSSIDRETDRTLSFLACRTAIKAGDPLGADERKNLIEKLLKSKTLYTCPHGRPTHIELPLSHLDHLFKRS